jgi:hypothetical protein
VIGDFLLRYEDLYAGVILAPKKRFVVDDLTKCIGSRNVFVLGAVFLDDSEFFYY